MKYFCTHCGQVNLYQHSPPIYCGYCGKKFNLNKDVAKMVGKPLNKESNENLTPQFSNVKPKFQLKLYNNAPEKFDDVLGAAGPANSPPNFSLDIQGDSSINTPQKSRDQILQEFQQEASTNRSEKN